MRCFNWFKADVDFSYDLHKQVYVYGLLVSQERLNFLAIVDFSYLLCLTLEIIRKTLKEKPTSYKVFNNATRRSTLPTSSYKYTGVFVKHGDNSGGGGGCMDRNK